jgi:uncharacterized surface protein with fasciclin (FAS1) repeats
MKIQLIAIAAASSLAFAGASIADRSAHNGSAYEENLDMTYLMTNGLVTADYVRNAGKPDIVDTAVSTGSFNTLLKAVQAAGLVDTLKGDGPYTVFAPTDAAFAKLPEGTLESLLADKEKLAAVLKYHVVPGKLDANAVTSKTALPTAQGSTLPVGDIKIADTDIMTSNGIIHVIDEVLIPAS